MSYICSLSVTRFLVPSDIHSASVTPIQLFVTFELSYMSACIIHYKNIIQLNLGCQMTQSVPEYIYLSKSQFPNRQVGNHILHRLKSMIYGRRQSDILQPALSAMSLSNKLYWPCTLCHTQALVVVSTMKYFP